ncbi:NlpC/P60 family protein [Sphingomonas sp. 2R-10]|uniref:NlpC/P60 family protein n=1 Tax=Sphingomonas sp. 2R-10 TaxID=3045148 RepID=UPI0013DE1A69|nr:NlpC/P60 family protein [Sphingomonas sp. 2R-10]MDJ0277444.1 NlpC/P60 family protein [Sphingomonas sp. 2R-10]
MLDSRVDAVRRDLADIRLAERVFAPHYAVPVRRTAGRTTPILDAAGGPVLSQALAGEPFDVLEFTSTHGWGRSPIDGTVGFVVREDLVERFDVSHVVVAAKTVVHAAPSTARPLPLTLPMGARVAATPVNDDWCEVDGGYVAATALLPLSDAAGDAVGRALALRGVPAIAGGRSGDGVDPAGLVFLACSLAGTPPPRFLDLQAAGFGMPLAEGDTLRRGDLLFFADHAVMLVDADTAIHADGTVRCEPVAALDRFGPVRARRRPA